MTSTSFLRSCLARRAALPFVGLALLALLAPGALAQDTISTDRPDFTDSARALPVGTLQVEFGTTWTELDNNADTWEIGETLARYGLAEDWELRLGLGSWIDVDAPGFDESGLTNASLGAKWELDDYVTAVNTDVALIFGTTLPTGDEDVTTDEWEPSAALAFGWEVTRTLSLGVNAGIKSADDGSNRFEQIFASASLGFGITETVGGFAEIYAFNEEFDGGSGVIYYNAGVLWQLSRDFQLDARVGTSSGSDALVDLFFGIGAGYRF